MKSAKRTLPRGIAYEQRATALARRLRIEVPPEPLTNTQWLTVWAEIGKVLLPVEPPEPRTLQTLWADVGMYLAELNEPEFQWGPGRRPGSKTSFQQEVVTAAAIRQRRSRANRSSKPLLLSDLIKRDRN
jgi:hypothetical protein